MTEVILYRRDLKVAYLEQDPHYPEELTVLKLVSIMETVR